MRTSLKPKNSSDKESAGVPISTAAVCIIKCIIIKINGAIVVKQSLFFNNRKKNSSVCTYIYVHVCMHIYIRTDSLGEPVALVALTSG